MKKLILSCLALIVMNSLWAEEKIAKDADLKTKDKVENKNVVENKFEYEPLSVRIAFPAKIIKTDSEGINYLIGASFSGKLADNTNIVGFYSDLSNTEPKNCQSYGFSLGMVDKLKSRNGVSVDVLGNENDEINGIYCSGLINASKRMNGISFSVIGNGLFSKYKRNPSKELENEGLQGGDELNGITVSAIVNSYQEVNGISLSLINGAETMTGISCGFLNLASENAIGYQLGIINIVNSSDVCLQAALLNVSNRASDTGQFGFWNIIRGEDSNDTMQFGLVNESETDSFQLGLLNFSEKGFLKFFPFINF